MKEVKWGKFKVGKFVCLVLVLCMVSLTLTPDFALGDKNGTESSREFAMQTPAIAPTGSPNLNPQDQLLTEEGHWEKLPLYGGDVDCLAIDPSNSPVLYAGTDGSGIFKSTDGGGELGAKRADEL